MPAAADNTIERKIQFYRIDAGQDQNGTPIKFNAVATLNHINQLQFTNSNTGRYYVDSSGHVLCCWVDSLRSPYGLRLGWIRRSSLPQLESGGSLMPLFIAPGSGLAEQTHVIIFDTNIVGVEFNFYGPRINRFQNYIWERCRPVCPTVRIQPLLRDDIIQRLNRLGDVRMFTLRVRASAASQLAQANKSLSAALLAAAKVGEPEDIEIILRPKRKGNLPGIVDLTKEILSEPEKLEGAKAFRVSGINAQSEAFETIDCLSAQFSFMKRVARVDERSRAVDTNSAYNAIWEAYHENEAQLLKAAGANVIT